MSSENAKLYAASIFEVAKENNKLDEIEEEISLLADLLMGERSFMLFLSAPLVPRKNKNELIDRIFSGRLSDTVIRFFKLLVERGYHKIIRDINNHLVEMIDESKNRQRMTVISSSGLDAGLLENLKSVFKEKLKKNILIFNEIDSSILGGIIVKTGDLIMDGSLAKDLRQISSKLIKSEFRGVAVYED